MRAIWTGAISFGLLYIPVKLYNASEEQELDFVLLRRRDLCRVRYMRVCEETGEEVDYGDIVRGFEYEDGKYIVLEEEDFIRANVRKTRLMEIDSFVDPEEIDLNTLEKPFYLEPAEGAEKVFALLREALKQSGKVAVARYVLRTREHLGFLRAQGEALLFNQIRFSGELRDPDDLALPSGDEISGEELDLAVRLVDQLSEPWRPEQYEDNYVEDLKRIIEEKIKGLEPEPVEEWTFPVEVSDLVEKLNESIQRAKERKQGTGNEQSRAGRG